MAKREITELTYKDIIRFESKFIKLSNEECWEWNGGCYSRGYGQIRIGPASHGAHRVSYKLYVASPEGLLVCHSCDNVKCVNPSHLWSGTPLSNMRDKIAKNRDTKGIDVKQSKLTEKAVLEIRDKAKEAVTQRTLAKQYGVSQFTIYALLKGKTWKHIQGKTN